MKIQFQGMSLDIGDVSYGEDKFTMKNETPYIEKVVKKYNTSKNYRDSLLPLKIRCLNNIKEYIGDSYSSYLDLLAGIGISAKIFNTNEYILNDFDGSCVDILKMNFSLTSITSFDMYKFPFYEVDFTFADFNNLTIKRMIGEYKPVLDNVFGHSKKYVLINDCSVFYLKYGEGSYMTYAKMMNNKLASSRIEFYEGFKIWIENKYPDWFLTRVESFRDTSFLLFVKKEKTLDFNFPFNFNLNVNDGTLPKVTIQ